jgi:hypothetical protein
VSIPRWVFFLVAVWVIAFGVFRIVVALRRRGQDEAAPDRPNYMRRGLYALSPRSHVLFGVIYLMLGASLIAMGLGWQPSLGFESCAGDPDSAGSAPQQVAPAGDSGRPN